MPGSDSDANRLRVPPPIATAVEAELKQASLTSNAFGERDAEDLVDSIGDNPARWNSLQESSFAIIALVFISTEACTAQDAGLFRLYRALESMKGGLDVVRRTAFKNAMAKKLMDTLLTCFLDCRLHHFTRRLAGLLLVETKENMDALRTVCERKSYQSRIHKIVAEGHHLIPKYICASLVSRLGIDASRNDRGRTFLNAKSQDSSESIFFGGFQSMSGPSWKTVLSTICSKTARKKKGLRSLLPRPLLKCNKCFSIFSFS